MENPPLDEENRNGYELLNQQINALKQRAEQLRDTALLKDSKSSDYLLTDALEELSTALEELQVTEEELYVQHEELLMTRQRLDDQRVRYEDLFQNAPDGYILTDLGGVIQQVNHAAARLLNIRVDYLTNKPFLLYFNEEDRTEYRNRLRQFVHQTAEQDAASTWEVRMAPRHAPEIIVLLKMTLVMRHHSEPVAIRWLLRDITEQRQLEDELRHLNTNLEARVRERTELLQTETRLKDSALARAKTARDEAEALRDIGSIIGSSLELPDVLEKIMSNVGRIVHHDTADILLVEDDTVTVVQCLGYNNDFDEKQLRSIKIPLSTTFPLNKIAQSGEGYIINVLREPTPWMKALGMKFTICSYVGLPILAQGILLGFLNLTNAVTNYYSKNELEILEAFSAQAAIAIQNAQLYDRAKAVSILEERQRLARDLHDAVNQSLFSSTIVAEAMLHGKDMKSPKLVEQLDYLLRLNRGAQAEMRALLLELRPAHLTDLNLSKQLRGLVDAVRGRKEIELKLEIDDGIAMPADVQIQFYRIAQEALNNIVKHSRAKKVEVRLLSDDECVRVDIKDDGRGIDPTQENKGMGLSNMRERAQEIGAEFSLTSVPGKGTEIKVIWMRTEETDE